MSAAPILSPFQTNILSHVFGAFAAGSKRVCLQSSALADILAIITHIAVFAAAAGRRVLILAHKREAFEQIGAKLALHDIEHSAYPAPSDARLQVADMSSVAQRLALGGGDIGEFDRIIISKCEPETPAPWRRVLDQFSAAHIFAITTTGEGLGNTFDKLISAEECQTLAATQGDAARSKHAVPPPIVEAPASLEFLLGRSAIAWAGRNESRLEQVRAARGYKPGWVYFRMKPPKNPPPT
jgi:hypothetical protein